MGANSPANTPVVLGLACDTGRAVPVARSSADVDLAPSPAEVLVGAFSQLGGKGHLSVKGCGIVGHGIDGLRLNGRGESEAHRANEEKKGGLGVHHYG